MVSYDEWTASQDSETVTVDGHDLEMAYRDEGEGDVLLFLHGIPTNSYLWREIAPAFEDDYRVLVPDMVGYGNSTMEDGFDRSIRAQEVAIEGLLDALGIDSCTFVGHDLGGGSACGSRSTGPAWSSDWCCRTPSPTTRGRSR
ncbi:MAG: alpha/beta fold hydrolase [Halalkalicoccus sp.]